MKRIIFYSLIFTIISCTRQIGEPQDSLYKKLVENYQMVVPITNIEDSIYIIDDSYNLYMNILNMQIIDRKQFNLALYSHIRDRTFIPVDNEFFSNVTGNRIIVDSIIKKKYHEEGIEGILSTYTLALSDKKISFFKKDINIEQIRYIIFLLFQHEIYVSWGDEGGCYIIRLDD